jgi:hypothetical protein
MCERGRCVLGAALEVWSLEPCGTAHEMLDEAKDGLRSRVGGCQFLDVRLRMDVVSDPRMLGAAARDFLTSVNVSKHLVEERTNTLLTLVSRLCRERGNPLIECPPSMSRCSMAWTTASRLDRTTCIGPMANLEFKIMSSSILGDMSMVMGCCSASLITKRAAVLSLSLISLPKLDSSFVLLGIRQSRYPSLSAMCNQQGWLAYLARLSVRRLARQYHDLFQSRTWRLVTSQPLS